MKIIDINEMRDRFANELKARRVNNQPDSYADQCGDGQRLYGIVGAVHTHAALGLNIGDKTVRQSLAQNILSYVDKQDQFIDEQTSGPAHALACSVAALNLLGAPLPATLGPLAPTDPNALDGWLNQLDWATTHKPLWGSTALLLASGLVNSQWIKTFTQHINKRLDHPDPQQALYRLSGAPWRIVSEIYHVMSALDAGCIAYPQHKRLADQLLALNWDDPQVAEKQTMCTDADWAWLLQQLLRHCPEISEEAYRQIRKVSARRVTQWHEQSDVLLEVRTFDFYSFLWSTAVYQRAVPDHFTGPALLDTLNMPALFRLYR